MKKKNLIAVTLAAALVLSLSACGTSASSASTETAESAADSAGEAADSGEDADAADSTEDAASTGEVRQLIVALNGVTKPYNYVNEDGELDGFEVKMLQAVDEAWDEVEITFEVTDFDAMFAGLDAARYDLIVGNISKNAEREEKYTYLSEPYFKSKFGLITAADNTEITSLDDLGGKKVPAGAGRSNALFIEAYNEEHSDNPIDIQYTDADATSLLVDLHNGRYDAALYNVTYAAQVTKEYGYEFNIYDIPNADDIEKPEAWLLFSKDNTALRDEFDAVIAELKADGTLSALSVEYFGEDFIPQ